MRTPQTLFTLIISLLFLSVVRGSSDFRLSIRLNELDRIEDFSFLPKPLNQQILEQLPRRYNSFDKLTYIFPVNDSICAMHDGSFDVYVLRDSVWKNLYQGKYYGYNFYSDVLNIDDAIYSLGGYGYWTHHNNLIKFSFEENSWQIVETQNLPVNYGAIIKGAVGDTVISMWGKYADIKSGLLEKEHNGYWLDINDAIWKRLQVDLNPKYENPEMSEHSPYFILKDYLVLYSYYGNSSGFTIIEKSSFNIFFYELLGTAIQSSPYHFNAENRIGWQNNKGTTDYIDISGIVDMPKIGEVRFEKETSNSIYYLIFIAFLILGIIGLFLLRKRKTNTKPSLKENAEVDHFKYLLEKIDNYKGQELTTSELDKLLEIQHLTYDNKRSHRSKLISEINLHSNTASGFSLIKRKRDDKDKRYYKYKIL